MTGARSYRLLTAAALAFALLAPAVHARPAQPPAPQGRYHYVYYPEKQVYYAPDKQMWFWLDGSEWASGAALPLIYQQYTRRGVNVYVDAERPYDEHQRVIDAWRKHQWKPYRYSEGRDEREPGGAPGPSGSQ
ncbi:MAG: hypothetical protein ACREVL_15425 [Solimonas sp.]